MDDSVYRPRRRELGLLWEEIADELLVFDNERNRAHSLNGTAARVWQACDGGRDLDALAVECGIDEHTLALALERLRIARLLDEPEQADGFSRRVMLRRSVAAGAALGVAIPVIRSIAAPSQAMAASCKPIAHACTSFSSCCPPANSCRNSLCCIDSGGACTNNSSCCVGTCSGGQCTSTH